MSALTDTLLATRAARLAARTTAGRGADQATARRQQLRCPLCDPAGHRLDDSGTPAGPPQRCSHRLDLGGAWWAS